MRILTLPLDFRQILSLNYVWIKRTLGRCPLNRVFSHDVTASQNNETAAMLVS